MFIEPVVGDGDVDVVPFVPVVAFVSADEKDRLSFKVEREQNSDLGSAS